MTTKRKWDRISDEKRQSAINELILFFEQERSEKIGVIAANQLIDFFLQSVGADIYNKGIDDAKASLNKRLEELNYDLDDLLDL